MKYWMVTYIDEDEKIKNTYVKSSNEILIPFHIHEIDNKLKKVTSYKEVTFDEYSKHLNNSINEEKIENKHIEHIKNNNVLTLKECKENNEYLIPFINKKLKVLSINDGSVTVLMDGQITTISPNTEVCINKN